MRNLMSNRWSLVVKRPPVKPNEARAMSDGAQIRGMHDLTFLVIDDDPFIRQLLSKILWGFGAGDVMTADTAEEGLRIVSSCDVNLVLCDLVLGGMNGLKFIKMVREMALFDGSGKHATPIVMMTAHSETQIIRTGMRLGANGCLAKPLSVPHIGKMISRLCRVEDPAAAALARRRAEQQRNGGLRKVDPTNGAETQVG